MKICTHPPCNEPAAAKGFCRRHYYQNKSGRALTMPSSRTGHGESARIVEGWRRQDGKCACCGEQRIGMSFHLRREDVICDACLRVLQTTDDPIMLESITLYLLEERAAGRAPRSPMANPAER